MSQLTVEKRYSITLDSGEAYSVDANSKVDNVGEVTKRDVKVPTSESTIILIGAAVAAGQLTGIKLWGGQKMRNKGFTIVEVIVGSTIMLIVVMLTLSVYTETNKVAVDQMQVAEIQHDVRAGMYFISEDVGMAGIGLPQGLSGYFVEGTDGYSPSPAAPDSIKLMGNLENPLSLKIETYSGGAGGAAATGPLAAAVGRAPRAVEHLP